MTEKATRCAQCGTVVRSADRFCEYCGATLASVRRIAVPNPTRLLDRPPEPCADCGNETYVDDYCAVCGHRRAEPDRAQAILDGIVVISDRGLEHPRNEDAAAAGILGDDAVARAVAVCDGVSTSPAAHTAAVAASTAGVAAMLDALAAARDPRLAVLAGLVQAAKAAAAAGESGADPETAPSCTYAAATVVPASTGEVQITVGSVGDSRVYWLPECPADARCLTVDDSLAQQLILAGAPADAQEVLAGAHTLTRWLGADAEQAPWTDTTVQTFTTTDHGVLLLCTDGLWNYLPDADDLGRFFAGSDARAGATALVDHALRAGGQDNITVAVIPIGGAP